MLKRFLSVKVLLAGMALAMVLGPQARSEDPAPGDVGSPECLSVQQEAQAALPESPRNHGAVVRAAANVVSPYVDEGQITEECSSCIISQIARKVPVEDQEACGEEPVICACEGTGSGMKVCSDGTQYADATCAADNCACSGVQGSPPSCTAYFDCSSSPGVSTDYQCSNPDDIGADAPGTCSSSFCDCVGFDYVCDGQTVKNADSCFAQAGCTCVGYSDGASCSTGTGHFDCTGDGQADTDIPNYYCENSCPRP